MAIYRFQPNTPIPNNPFYYPLTDSLTSGGGTPLIIGAGLYVDYSTGTIQSTAAINVVTSVTGIAPIVVNGSISEPVIQVEVATPSTTGVVRIGNNLQIAAGLLSVANATTTTRGVVRLNNTTTSSAIDEALTANQGRILQDQINSISAISNLTLAGTLNATTGRLATVTAAGTSKGFAVNGFLPSPVAGLTNYYVIVSTAGSYDPPGAGGPYGAVVGDWFVCDGTSWVYFAVGYVPPAATDTTPGIVELATTAETGAGLDNTRAITPAGASATYIKKSTLTGKGQLISATSSATPSSILPGADGTLLTACSDCPSGLTWSSPSSNYLPCSIITNKGIIVTGTAPNVAAALPLGTNGQYLSVNTACNTGLEWVTSTAIGCSFITGKGSLIVGCSANFPSALPVGGNGCILTANCDCTLGMEWKTNTAIPCSLVAGKGSLITGTSAGQPAVLPICGTNDYILRTNSVCPTGLEWVPNPYIPCCLLPGRGALVVAESFHTPCALAIGLDGYYLRANCLCPLGVEWAAGCPCITGVSSVTAGTGLTGGTITTTGTIAIAPTGISPGTYYNATFSVGADGRITGAGSNFPVTCVTAGEGLCGGTITCMGTICLPTFAGVQGNWTAPTMTVDSKGRITAISNGSTGSVSCVGTGTGLTGGPITSTGTIALANTGVTAGLYYFGPVQYCVAVNAQGQISSITCIAELFANTETLTDVCSGTVSLGLCALTWGMCNVHVGTCAGYTTSAGSGGFLLCNNANNTFVGYESGGGAASPGTCIACCNVGVGFAALGCLVCGSGNVAIGAHAACRGGCCSVAVGDSAANLLSPTSCNNVSVGYAAFAGSNSLAQNTIAIGAEALAYGPTGTRRSTIAIGYQAGFASSVNESILLGLCAGQYATNATGKNISIGSSAGVCYQGSGSVFIGSCAGRCISPTSLCETFVGSGAGDCATGTAASTFLGSNAGRLSVNQTNSLLAGYCAGAASSGAFNTFLGSCAGLNTAGCANVFSGYLAGYCQPGNSNVSIGSEAGCLASGGCNFYGGDSSGCSTTGYCNTAIGVLSGAASSGNLNVLMGSAAGYCIVGNCNLYSGASAGYSYFGNQTVAIGAGAGTQGVGDQSVFVGSESGYQISGSSCVTAIGFQSGWRSQGNCNLFLGVKSGLCSNTNGSIAIGFEAGWGLVACCSISIGNAAGLGELCSGSFNISVGNFAAWKGWTGSRTISIGTASGYCLRGCAIESIFLGECAGAYSGGTNNIYIGTKTGCYNGGYDPSLSVGCNNIVIGSNSANTISRVDNVVWLGQNINPSPCSVPSTNSVVIGGSGMCYYYWGGTSGGWNQPSDRRMKTNIVDSALGLSFLEKIQLREFSWCEGFENTNSEDRNIGVIAQEVLEAVCSTACSEHLKVVSESEGRYWVGTTGFIFPLINAVKELSAENRALRCELTELRDQVAALALCLQ